MKTILVSLDQHSYSQAVLETALILGRSFESYIEGFARGPDLHNLIAVEVPLAVPLSAEVPPQQTVESAHQQFETFMRAHAVPEGVGGAERVVVWLVRECAPGCVVPRRLRSRVRHRCRWPPRIGQRRSTDGQSTTTVAIFVM